jgi:hypothetical protein
MMDLIKATTPNQRIVVASALLATLVFGVVACGSTEERETMERAENDVITEAATPTIDASAPIETATFALG